MLRRELLPFNRSPIGSSFFKDSILSPLEWPLKEVIDDLNFQLENERSNVLETDNAFLAMIDMPGVGPSDISIELEGEKLMVSAKRKDLFSKEGSATREYRYRLNLPRDVEQEKINAHYENGVLSLAIPKIDHKILDHKSRKKIEVLTGPKSKSWSDFLSFNKNEKEKVAS